MSKSPVKPQHEEARRDREQVKKANAAMKCELEQTAKRADDVIERLRKAVEKKIPTLRIVKAAAR